MPSIPHALLLRTAAFTFAAFAAGWGATNAYAEDAASGAKAVPQNDLLNATLWMDNSVEYKASVESLFALAKLRLDQALQSKDWTALPDMQSASDMADKPLAIITDLDETVLDNDPYESSLVTRGTSYSSKDYNNYVNAQVTGAIPGAVDFLNYADSKGVKVFYVSNRKGDQEEATRANMEKLGFPMGGNTDTVLLQNEKEEWTGAKESRLQYVAKDYRVVLVMGDNLGDFTDKASGTLDERESFLQASSDHWGHDWIMFPNPEYGSWESAAFGGDYSKSEDQRRQEKIDLLKPWDAGASGASSSSSN